VKPGSIAGVLKLLLLGIVLAGLVIPALAARSTDGPRGLRSMLLAMFVAELCYGFFLLFVYPRLM
jgi:hypothetical protein